jgi:hypothetical protein
MRRKIRAWAERRLRPEVKLVQYCTLGGLLLAAPDLSLSLLRGGQFVTGWAVVGLWTGGSLLLAGVLAPLLLLGRSLRSRLRSDSQRAWLDSAAVAIASIVPSVLLFSGRGISRTTVGTVGPWVLPVIVLLTTRVALTVLPRITAFERKGLPVRTAAGAILLSLVVLATYAERTAYPGLYRSLHVTLIVATVLMSAAALSMLRTPWKAGLIALLVAAGTLPWASTFPRSNFERMLMTDGAFAAGRVIGQAQSAIDMDGDGRSPIFGGGDCDDFDAKVYVGAPEMAGDGRDSNCDARNDPLVHRRSYAPFEVDETTVRTLRAEASKYPTVVIMIDTLRADRIRMPAANLLALAGDSIRFTRAYASSSSTPQSVPAIVTGRVSPSRDAETVAQAISRAGRSTAFVAVDVVEEVLRDYSNALHGFTKLEIIHEVRGSLLAHWGGGLAVPTDERVTKRALEVLNAPNPPAFTWVHYFDLHQWNHLNGDSLPAKDDLTRYDAVLAKVDAALAPLLRLKDRFNLVVVADHGEALGARGMTYHTRYLFDEVARVPLMVRIPGVPPAVVETPVGLTALFNTLLDLQGLPVRSAPIPDSLLGLVNASAPGDGPGFPGFAELEWALVHGRHRLLYAPDSQILQLFDVLADADETRDLSDRDPDVAAELLDRLFMLRNATRALRN